MYSYRHQIDAKWSRPDRLYLRNMKTILCLRGEDDETTVLTYLLTSVIDFCRPTDYGLSQKRTSISIPRIDARVTEWL